MNKVKIPSLFQRCCLAISLMMVCLVGYEILRLVAGDRLFPPLRVIGRRWLTLWADGTMFWQLLASARRSFLGLAIAVIAGLPVAGLLARFPKIDAVFSPLIYLFYPIPKVVFLPLLMLLLGLKDASKVAMIVLIVLFQVILSLRDAFKSLDRAAFRAVRAFGGGSWELIRHVVVPASLPALFSALRISSGTALAVLFIAESFASESGLGFFIMDAWSRVAYADLHCGVLSLALFGLCLFGLLEAAERLSCPWR